MTFAEWLEEREKIDEAILSLKDFLEKNKWLMGGYPKDMRDFLKKNPMLMHVVDIRKILSPKDQQWMHGYVNGMQQARNDPTLTYQDNIYQDRTGKPPPDAVNYYDGWNDGLASVRAKTAV